MKKPITILVCCALLAPLAFAQPESKGKGQGASYHRRNNGDGNDHQNDK